MVFSFWPDTIMLKEIGDPLEIADYLDLSDRNILARNMLAQGRQNTNYAITLYACHPFFVQGVATMTNGENTAFVPIREFLMSRQFPGYVGYQSDSEVFTHILHYTYYNLGMGLEAYKHIITPLRDDELARHPETSRLRLLKHTCRPLIIDGPNCVIGFHARSRPCSSSRTARNCAPGSSAASPACTLSPRRSAASMPPFPTGTADEDFQPMKYDIAYVDKKRREIKKWNQWEPFTHPH